MNETTLHQSIFRTKIIVFYKMIITTTQKWASKFLLHTYHRALKYEKKSAICGKVTVSFAEKRRRNYEISPVQKLKKQTILVFETVVLHHGRNIALFFSYF